VGFVDGYVVWGGVRARAQQYRTRRRGCRIYDEKEGNSSVWLLRRSDAAAGCRDIGSSSNVSKTAGGTQRR
jgi:hypothetical protein